VLGLQPSTKSPLETPVNRKTRVLLVDGDADSRTVYRAILQHYEYDVLEAVDGPAALEMALRELPDVVVTELTVPKLSGLDLMLELRDHEQTRDTCIIVLTAVSFESEKKRAIQAGCQVFLSKPVEPQMLVEQIRRLTHGAIHP
jgi:CheY-like chemotaxis protein